MRESSCTFAIHAQLSPAKLMKLMTPDFARLWVQRDAADRPPAPAP